MRRLTATSRGGLLGRNWCSDRGATSLRFPELLEQPDSSSANLFLLEIIMLSARKARVQKSQEQLGLSLWARLAGVGVSAASAPAACGCNHSMLKGELGRDG
jgi:hypothetical protein